MKFNRIVLVVVSLALMLFALAGCGKDAAQDSQKKQSSRLYRLCGYTSLPQRQC